MSQHEYHFEDLPPDFVLDLGTFTIHRKDIVEFAEEFDPQPFHLDDEAGKASMLGGLAASGWHIASLTMRLLAEELLNKSSCQGSPGVSKLNWLKPVFPEDVLSARVKVLSSRALRSRTGVGLVNMELETRNQHDVPVLVFENTILFGLKNTETV